MRPHPFAHPIRSGFDWNSLAYTGIMLIFWILIIFGIVMLVNWSARRYHETNASSSTAIPNDPLNIIKARYARGEITKAEYDTLRKDLAKP